MKNSKYILFAFVVLALAACGGKKEKKSYDEMAMSGLTTRTENLKVNIKTYADKGVMVGQIHATMEGVGWQCDSDRSDLRAISNERPAVIGYDISGVENGASQNVNGLSFNLMRDDILANFKRGALLILNWRGTNYQDNDDALEQQAKALAKYLGTLQDGYGIKAPVVLNLYPIDGTSWYCQLGKEDYISLYQKMQDLLDDEDVTNVVYGYSEAYSAEGFLDRFPDSNIDVIDAVVLQTKEQADSAAFAQQLNAAIGKALPFAQEHNCALGLTAGIESVPFANTFTATILPALKDRRISYLMFGSNHGDFKDGHFYTPYPGAHNEMIQDFMALVNDKRSIFMKTLNGLYLKH